MPSISLSPPSHPGLKKFDKSLFTTTHQVYALLLKDLKSLPIFLGNKKSPSPLPLSLPSHPSIIDYPLTLLSENELKELPKRPKALLLSTSYGEPPNEISLPLNYAEQLKNIKHLIKPFTITLDSNYWTHDQLLKACLPEELRNEAPTSFTIAGHLAHLNLKDEYLRYKHLIGEIILFKYPQIKTVVNKTNEIHTVYRTFSMELLAGEADYEVIQKESGCQFKFDFRKVYWNSRLATEHERLVNLFEPGEAVCDVMAGVGPFTVPAGKKGVWIWANDLNPDSYKWLKFNLENNKVETVKSFNEDGADFIKKSANSIYEWHIENPVLSKNIYVKREKEEGLLNKEENINKKRKGGNDIKSVKKRISKETPSFFSHYVMNLPDSAINFLPNYVGLFSRGFPNKSIEEIKSIKGYRLPYIHCHHFEKYKEEEVEGEVSEFLANRMLKKMNKLMDFDFDLSKVNFHVVRDVAPCKIMYCISFELPEAVAFRNVDI
ncbi:tRNA (guanine) methyltransferase [Martiniozyma asiatica (nom. inval.)]|nr:tRNA (guanine) methyltransferase [Martiniozyma asiatica]